MKNSLLLVMCGRHVKKLGGQDRRWLKVAGLISNIRSTQIVINDSYASLAKKTEINLPENMLVVAENRNKYVSYIWINLVIFFRAFHCRKIHYCGNSLEMTPSAILVWALLRREITFSFNGVSVNYLIKTRQRKAVLLLKIMNRISRRLEVLNETVVAENFFDRKKMRLSSAMYAGSNAPILRPKNPKKIVFAGHLYAAKGAHLLLQIIETCPDKEFEFVIYGERVSDSDVHVNEWVEKIASYDNVSFMNHTDDMSTAYSDVSVVLSLQTISNYPSQVVLEGLVHGAAVVVVKSGDSERFGHGPGIFYLPMEFDAAEYWQEISRASECSMANSSSISAAALDDFSAHSYVERFVSNMEIDAYGSNIPN